MSRHPNGIETYRRTDGKWAWRHWNQGRKVATDGGQGFNHRSDCLRGCANHMGGRIEGDTLFRMLPDGGYEHLPIRDAS